MSLAGDDFYQGYTPPPASSPVGSSSEEEDGTASAYALAMQMANGQIEKVKNLHSRIRLLEHDNQQLAHRCCVLQDGPLVQELVETASAKLLEKINAQNAGNVGPALTQHNISAMLWNELMQNLAEGGRWNEGVELPIAPTERGEANNPECQPGMGESDMMDTSQEVTQVEDDVMDTEMESTETARNLEVVESQSAYGGGGQSFDFTTTAPHIAAQMVWTGASNGASNKKRSKSVKRKGDKMKIKQRSKVRRIGDIEEIFTEREKVDDNNPGEADQTFMDGWDIDGRRTTRSMVRHSRG